MLANAWGAGVWQEPGPGPYAYPDPATGGVRVLYPNVSGAMIEDITRYASMVRRNVPGWMATIQYGQSGECTLVLAPTTSLLAAMADPFRWER